ncbi:rab-GTPase-TBC domain-containing protein [Pseudomassariella vexata]|uniref:Rab-GTPase-TBC domain-domain-containing protein n=1 Tax=Pseudomassariella vexata TaxID=1141098 RepID=A0A1Y2EDP5_9PEZI|nr:rab-GTPase-TBC domain-containing protein [Pseudomassariella vexata]ORY69699.1 rab-GTPase-TBC domain-domain-containing protein [Pseudomassariella vexata]
MRSLVESTTRWQETIKYSSSLADLQRAVKLNGPSSPCISGCRSICWKAFLLNHGAGTSNWSHALLESRSTYASLKDHFLKYIRHPEYLANVSVDPLADDPDSPWNTLRQDEELRSEIQQDVQRLPDESFYHEPRIQTLIIDVLFIYCKLNPDVGGYRQGMHELLAPIVFVIEQDAIHPAERASEGSADLTMVEMLDANFIEHDAFALFSKVMENAKGFYEVGDETELGQSTIVEKSQHIHEELLHQVDPDLSNHLKNIEILPQIFLIRWIRLLFSREFPFGQMLVLWDTLFAVDPSLQLIDFICTAMLIRIHWDLLDADYSVALQLLLKYPPPQAPHGPHTFVDDAVYLRDHANLAGASTLIMKYTGKPPASPEISSRPSTPKTSGMGVRQNARGARSRLSPSRFIQQQGSVEALFQGAARGVLERGERLGINQAMRDAMLEIRRNVSEARSSIRTGRDLFAEAGPNSTAMRAVAGMDRRNKQLASLLDETLTSLKALTTSELDDKQKHVEYLEIAVAKLQFVKVYLEDSTMVLPEDDCSSSEVRTPPPQSTQPEMIIPEPPNDAVAAMVINTPYMVIDSPESQGSKTPTISSLPPTTNPLDNPSGSNNTDSVQNDLLATSKTATPVQANTHRRPQGPNPTRSTLAQSSFSWMLEPDQSSSQAPSPPFKPNPSSYHRKRPSANASRGRTAFLFGEVPPDVNGELSHNIFGLEPLAKGK